MPWKVKAAEMLAWKIVSCAVRMVFFGNGRAVMCAVVFPVFSIGDGPDRAVPVGAQETTSGYE